MPTLKEEWEKRVTTGSEMMLAIHFRHPKLALLHARTLMEDYGYTWDRVMELVDHAEEEEYG